MRVYSNTSAGVEAGKRSLFQRFNGFTREDIMNNKSILYFVSILLILIVPTIDAQKTAFEPLGHKYVYDVQDDGSVRCTWTTTILPKQTSILYTYSFRGGETKDYNAEDSLGQIIDIDVNEAGGQRAVSLQLAGYQIDKPYQFNVSFTWNGLLTRHDDRNTLYTSVNVGEPQAAEIIVLPPSSARIGTSVIIKGNATEPFEKEVLSGRNALVWRTSNTGNDTEIMFRANYNYYNAQMSISDNYLKIITGAAVLIIAALLLGYRKKIPQIASKIKERI